MSYQQFRPTGFKLLPEVVKNLLIINGLFFLSTIVFSNTFHVSLIELLGLYHFESDLFQPYQIVTHLFMHGGFWHLFSNMFALWMFGNVLENVWGGKKFLIYYLVTGLGAALIHSIIIAYDINGIKDIVSQYASDPTFENFTLFVSETVKGKAYTREFMDQVNSLVSQWSQDPNNSLYSERSIEVSKMFLQDKMSVPTVGASGAVFGVLLAFGMLFPNTVIYLYFAFPIKAKYFVILYGLFELYAGIQNNPSDNVAHFAHLGGMLFGYFLIRYWDKNGGRYQYR
jgi:membrane associated rhomboid family serine protease